jgi:hydroxymethylbilane synthase
VIVVGTRGSALALAQTEIVRDALRHRHPGVAIRVERIMTTGDTRSDVPLSQLGRGIFVTEIETALREGRIDLAVHSAKDLPSTLANDLTLAAILPRADARDVLVSPYGSVAKLPPGARVGTSSPRRACQLRALRADLEPVDVRGNVDTRLRKLAEGAFDALVLAAAGLIRLGRASEITEWLNPVMMVPSVGQGALAVETRANDERTIGLVASLDDLDTRAAVLAERAFLAELGAGCRAAAGAHARVEGERLRILALIGAVDGRHVRTVRAGDAARAEELGSAVARELLRAGGAVFLARERSTLSGKVVAVTRPVAQIEELAALLTANGATAVSCPAIEIQPIVDHTLVDAALEDLAHVNWMVFTSANAVHAVADRLNALGIGAPESLRLAAVGSATAGVLAQRIRRADFFPSRSTAETLADELPDAHGQTVLFPRGDLAADTLLSRLRARGARVRDVIIYRTVPGTGLETLAASLRDGVLDAVIFTSPSTVRAAAALFTTREAADRPAIICVGPTTARAARELGLEPDAEAPTPTVGGIVETLERCLAHRNAAPALASQ